MQREPNWVRLLQTDGHAFWVAKSDHGTLWFQPKSWSNHVFTPPTLAESFVKPPDLVDLEGPWNPYLTTDGRAFWRQETALGTAHYQPSDWAGKTFTNVDQIASSEKGHNHMPSTNVTTPQNFGVLLSNAWQQGERISGTAAEADPTGGVTLSQSPTSSSSTASTEQCPVPPDAPASPTGSFSPWLAGAIVVVGIAIVVASLARRND